MNTHGKSKVNRKHQSANGKKRARIEKEFGTKSERVDYGRQRAIMVAKQRKKERE